MSNLSSTHHNNTIMTIAYKSIVYIMLLKCYILKDYYPRDVFSNHICSTLDKQATKTVEYLPKYDVKLLMVIFNLGKKSIIKN
jgi:hypothetical protein